jgi:hypothetical protein
MMANDSINDDEFSAEQILMEANIREFGHSISLICALETGGKITPQEAYALIKKTWRELKTSRRGLFSKKTGGDTTATEDHN